MDREQRAQLVMVGILAGCRQMAHPCYRPAPDPLLRTMLEAQATIMAHSMGRIAHAMGWNTTEIDRLADAEVTRWVMAGCPPTEGALPDERQANDDH